MALNDLELSLMAFPQRWDGPSGVLTLSFLLLPVGDPTVPLGGGPQFAGTTVDLVINLVSGLDSLPSTATAPSKTVKYTAQPPPVAPTLFPRCSTSLWLRESLSLAAKCPPYPPQQRVS